MDALDHQRQLLDHARQIYRDTPISDETARAYLATPRHRFVRRYREWASPHWQDVTESNLDQHLATLYADKAIILFGDDDQNIPSTISQPSFVLRMLDLLQLEPGHTVLELGAGSGWNAALIGQIVGPTGRVFSLEIIPDMAARASAAIAEVGITNVQVIAADGSNGYASEAPYDRIVFTAGAYDLPHPFFEQIAPSGLLLMVIKNRGGGDTLFLLKHVGDHFESRHALSCGFVPMTGAHQADDMEPIALDSLPEWVDMRHREIGRRPFWWGGKGRESFVWQTMGIRSFLGIAEPLFQTFKIDPQGGESGAQECFGVWDRESQSLALAKDDLLISYGTMVATERLLTHVHRWVDLGMPAAAGFHLRVYPSERPLVAKDDQWIMRRQDSQFLWSL